MAVVTFIDRSLFRKIFLWFWLAIGVALVLSSLGSRVARRSVPGRRATGLPKQTLRERVRAADAIVRKGGTAELAEFARNVDYGEEDRTFVIGEDGLDVRGAQLPSGISAVARMAASSGTVETAYIETGIAAKRLGDKTGHYWVIAVSGQQSSQEGNEMLVVRILLEVIAIALGALLLARYITSPILILRGAAARIESGDLSTRVVGRLGNRPDELGDLGRNFDLMAQRIEDLVVAQRDLIGDVSHELRSPLARLSVAMGLARRTAGPEVAHHLDRIESEAERLNTLIGQLLALSRLESAAQSARARVDFSALIQEVAADGAFEARAGGCEVKAEVLSGVIVRGSVEQIRSAAENVVRNAVRYAPEGSTVRIIMDLRTESGAPVAVMSVSDEGPGVPEESLTRIFEPFYQVPSDHAAADSGTGLGLAITSRAIRLHAGSVKAFNDPRGGLTVEIRLPIAIGAP